LLVTSIVIKIGFDNYTVGNKTTTLPSVEIRQYEGQDLSSINDFRENSIKGPQYIDEETYQLKLIGLVQRNITYSYEDVLSRFDKK
jgi:DMSO/TMAO reductase YedYZ molybdopterin-dependent catalytic subunit